MPALRLRQHDEDPVDQFDPQSFCLRHGEVVLLGPRTRGQGQLPAVERSRDGHRAAPPVVRMASFAYRPPFGRDGTYREAPTDREEFQALAEDERQANDGRLAGPKVA